MKKRIFLDINVMLDFLGERISFYDSIARVLSFLESNKFKIIVSPISYATVSYFSDFENAFKISIKRCQNISILSQVIGI